MQYIVPILVNCNTHDETVVQSLQGRRLKRFWIFWFSPRGKELLDGLKWLGDDFGAQLVYTRYRIVNRAC